LNAGQIDRAHDTFQAAVRMGGSRMLLRFLTAILDRPSVRRLNLGHL